MKHRSIQFGTRRNPERSRVDRLRLAADSSSASFRGEEDPYERGEPYCSQPTVSSCERNPGQVESDAGFEPLLDVVVKTVQELMRHASSRLTLDVYAQALTPAKRAAHLKLVGLIQPAAETAIGPLWSHAEDTVAVSS